MSRVARLAKLWEDKKPTTPSPHIHTKPPQAQPHHAPTRKTFSSRPSPSKPEGSPMSTAPPPTKSFSNSRTTPKSMSVRDRMKLFENKSTDSSPAHGPPQLPRRSYKHPTVPQSIAAGNSGPKKDTQPTQLKVRSTDAPTKSTTTSDKHSTTNDPAPETPHAKPSHNPSPHNNHGKNKPLSVRDRRKLFEQQRNLPPSKSPSMHSSSPFVPKTPETPQNNHQPNTRHTPSKLSSSPSNTNKPTWPKHSPAGHRTTRSSHSSQSPSTSSQWKKTESQDSPAPHKKSTFADKLKMFERSPPPTGMHCNAQKKPLGPPPTMIRVSPSIHAKTNKSPHSLHKKPSNTDALKQKSVSFAPAAQKEATNEERKVHERLSLPGRKKGKRPRSRSTFNVGATRRTLNSLPL